MSIYDISEGGCSLTRQITTLAKRARCSDSTICIMLLLSRCSYIVESLMSYCRHVDERSYVDVLVDEVVVAYVVDIKLSS
jgi:hypothetical protein